MNKHKLILPISIILGCIILGGFYYFAETKSYNEYVINKKTKKNGEKNFCFEKGGIRF